MPYTPTLADWNSDQNQNVQSGAYVPTAADWNSTQATPESGAVPQRGFLANFGLGALGATRNFLQDVADLPPDIAPNLFPRGALPQVPQGQGAAYTAGNIAGNIAPFVAGGELLEAPRAMAAASDLPAVSKAAQWLGGEIPNITAKFGGSEFLPAVTRLGTGGAIYGGITNPDDRIGGAIKGGLESAPFAALPFAPGAIKSGLDYFNPQKMADSILDTLGEGKDLGENARSLTQDVNNSYKTQMEPLAQGFNDIGEQVGNQSILDPVGKENSSYLNMNPKVQNYFTPKIEDLHDEFLKNPTYDNGRQLFSQYASEVARLQGKGPANLDAYENSQLQSLQKGKDAIDSDIQNFLGTKSPDLVDQYNSLKRGWLQNVIPYRASDVNQLLGDNPIIPTNIHTLFGSARQLPDVNDMKVFNDLSPDSQNKIIYSAIGKQAAIKTPDALNTVAKKLPEQGLGDLVSNPLKSQFEDLDTAIDRRNAFTAVTGGGLGYLGGHSLGLPPELILAAMTGGGYVANKLTPKIMQNKVMQSLNPIFYNAAQKVYGPLSTAIRANIIPGGQ